MNDVLIEQACVEALKLIFLLAFPMLVALLVVGLVSGALQSATLIHDPVIGYAARLAALVVTLYLALPTFARSLYDLCMLVYQ